MNVISISCIVEGHGEVVAFPILLRRIVKEIDPGMVLRIPNPPHRVARSSITKSGELERAVGLAAGKNNGLGAVLILLDADRDCAAKLGPELLGRAKLARSDIPIAVVLAQKEYEAWFLEAAESLRGKRGLSQTMSPPQDSESISGAKEWLRSNMQDRNRAYQETVDQPALSSLFDLQTARRNSSFDKLFRDIERLMDELKSAAMLEQSN